MSTEVLVALSGLVGVIIGSSVTVILEVYKRRTREKDPDFVVEKRESDKPYPQEVRWGPVDGRPPGMIVEGRFISWGELEIEFRDRLIPQIDYCVPVDYKFVIMDFRHKRNWLLRIATPTNEIIAKIFIGPDPEHSWKFDGLVRIEVFEKDVLDVFQRYSDNSYRRLY